MQNQFSRTQLLLGKPAIDTLAGARVALFGVGGVGGYVLEVLARSGVGALDLIDDDRVCVTNINRQLLATISTIGKKKVDVAEERVLDINPHCIVRKYQTFYLPDNADQFDFTQYDYVVDCIDTVTAKLDLIQRCYNLNIPIISCMGAAYKLDATQFEVTDIWKTINDPLAKIIRKKLRKTNVKHLKVVYSPEEPLESIEQQDIVCENQCTNPKENTGHGKQHHVTPSSNAWVPAAAGLICGGEVVKDLINFAHTMRIDLEHDPDNEHAKIAAQKADERLKEARKIALERQQNCSKP